MQVTVKKWNGYISFVENAHTVVIVMRKDIDKV